MSLAKSPGMLYRSREYLVELSMRITTNLMLEKENLGQKLYIEYFALQLLR